jgi:LPXTG-motif cell wall-anchored protein
MLLAAMLAMVLVAAAPALAQSTAIQYDNSVSDDDTLTEICTNVADASASQVQYGDANAASVEGDAVAEIAQELGISQEQVNECLNTVLAGDLVVEDDADVDEDGDVDETDVEIAEEEVACGCDVNGDGEVATAAAAASASASSSASSSSESGAAELPDTGGASLFTLGAGALLVGGGLLARRIFS